MKSKLLLFVLLSALAYMALLAACNAAPTQQPESPLPVGTPIPFTILIGGDQPLATLDAAIEPGVIVIDSMDEALHTYPAYSPLVIELLASVNFEKDIVVLISQGNMPGTLYSVMPGGIYRWQERINVYADFLVPGNGWASGAALTSPFVLVAVSRDALLANSDYPSFILISHEITPTPPSPE